MFEICEKNGVTLDIYSKFKDNQSLLHNICATGHNDILEYLLYHVNYLNESNVGLINDGTKNHTLFTVACGEGHLAIIKTLYYTDLIRNNLDWDQCTDSGICGLGLAAVKSHHKVVEWVINNIDDKFLNV